MTASTLTFIHVLLSLAGIGSGFVVLYGFVAADRLPRWTAIFLATTILTSATGFLFRSASFGAPQIIGLVSLLVLVFAVLALYVYGLRGPWRPVYVVGAMLALWLNVFVGVIQAFQKLPFLQPLAPTQTEPAFFGTELVVLAGFIVLGIVGVRSFHPTL